MSGWSISLSVPPADQTASTIDEYFEYAQRKRVAHCGAAEARWLAEDRERTLERFEADGRFFLSTPVDQTLAIYADFEAAFALANDWVVSGEQLDHLIELFRDAATALADDVDDPEWDYTCYVEAWPIALCEFARDRDYRVELSD